MNKRVVLSGELPFFNLPDLVQFLGSNSSTGVLRLESKYAAEPGYIHFVAGNPVNAFNGSRVGLDALYSFFGWSEGTFEFSLENVPTEKAIRKSRMEIILDGLRLLDDGHIERIGPTVYARQETDAAAQFGKLPLIRGPFVDYMYVVDEEEFLDGERIVEEGKHVSWIWVILEGAVDIVKETPQGPVTILRIGNGAFIGSISALLWQGSIHHTTAVAVGNVLLGVLNSQRLSWEYSILSPHLRGFLISLEKRLKQVTEKAASVRLNPETAFEETLEDRTPYIQQGAEGNGLVTITQGRATVARSLEGGHLPLAHLYRGDFFGEVPFLEMGHEPYSASVYTDDALQTEPVDTRQLQSEYDRLSSLFKNIIENIANRISVTTMVACELQPKGSETAN